MVGSDWFEWAGEGNYDFETGCGWVGDLERGEVCFVVGGGGGVRFDEVRWGRNLFDEVGVIVEGSGVIPFCDG